MSVEQQAMAQTWVSYGLGIGVPIGLLLGVGVGVFLRELARSRRPGFWR